MLNPDLVVAWPDNMTRSVSGRLTDLGIEFYAPQAQSLDDIYQYRDRLLATPSFYDQLQEPASPTESASSDAEAVSPSEPD